MDDKNEGYNMPPEPMAPGQGRRAYAGAGAFRAARAAQPNAQPQQHAPAAEYAAPPPQPQPNVSAQRSTGGFTHEIELKK